MDHPPQTGASARPRETLSGRFEVVGNCLDTQLGRLRNFLNRVNDQPSPPGTPDAPGRIGLSAPLMRTAERLETQCQDLDNLIDQIEQVG